MNPVNPVDLIDHAFRHSDIDYGFRPRSYWEPPSDFLAAVLRNVKGTERRAMISDYFRNGRLDELLPELTCDELSQGKGNASEEFILRLWGESICRVTERTKLKSSEWT